MEHFNFGYKCFQMLNCLSFPFWLQMLSYINILCLRYKNEPDTFPCIYRQTFTNDFPLFKYEILIY